MSRSFSLRRRFAQSGAQAVPCARLVFAFFFAAVCLVGAPLLRAQSADSQQDSQDVAESARKARARKQRAATERHIYTNEDLRRSKILTPEDQSRAAAAKENQQPVASPALPEAQPLDANSATPQEPLGDVARRYRNAKKISPFHLPTNRPELASPKIVVPIPELKAIAPAQPQPPPRNFTLLKPSAPMSRITSPNAPVMPSARPRRIDPFVGRRTDPLLPSNSYAHPFSPAIAAPRPRTPAPVRPAISPKTNSPVIVRPGDTLWTISRQHLGRGARWLELMAANPNLPDPERLVPGTVLSIPAQATSRSNHTAGTVTVHAGDTLSKLALASYGHASYWSCIAHANRSLSNPHRLAIGQVLALPVSCDR